MASRAELAAAARDVASGLGASRDDLARAARDIAAGLADVEAASSRWSLATNFFAGLGVGFGIYFLLSRARSDEVRRT